MRRVRLWVRYTISKVCIFR